MKRVIFATVLGAMMVTAPSAESGIWFDGARQGLLFDLGLGVGAVRNDLAVGTESSLALRWGAGVGFGLALLMYRPFRGQAIYYIFFILPMLTVPIVIAYTGEMILYQNGPLNDILSRLSGLRVEAQTRRLEGVLQTLLAGGSQSLSSGDDV